MHANLRRIRLLLTAVVFLGCDIGEIAASSAKFKEDFSYTHELAPGGRISVESFNGSIRSRILSAS